MTFARFASAALLALACVSAAAGVSSGFDHDAEGWTSNEGVFAWTASAGLPPGAIGVASPGSGGDTLLVAPASFLGDRSSAVGGYLSFDIRFDYPGTGPGGAMADVVLHGAGRSIRSVQGFIAASRDWESILIPLTPFGNWLSDDCLCHPSLEDFTALMTDLTALDIRPFQGNTKTGSSAMLDNVALVPEPASAALLGAGVIALMGLARSRSAPRSRAP
jgi:hypothetical protein